MSKGFYFDEETEQWLPAVELPVEVRAPPPPVPMAPLAIGEATPRTADVVACAVCGDVSCSSGDELRRHVRALHPEMVPVLVGHPTDDAAPDVPCVPPPPGAFLVHSDVAPPLPDDIRGHRACFPSSSAGW
jgi:hypothetical protein